MEWFWLVAGVPLLVSGAFCALSDGEISVSEVVVSTVLSALIAVGVSELGRYGKTADVEVWNGRVTGKERAVVSCEHSYACNCRQVCSGSGSNQTCWTHCDTCWEHSYDVSWMVNTTAGGDVEIGRIDRQGLGQPPRWTAVTVGEPASLEHGFTNYIKAVPESLFAPGAIEGYGELPGYPRVHDYYRISRVIGGGALTSGWSGMLSEALEERGGARQVNAIIVAVDSRREPGYADALRAAWLGGKKNDAVLVIGHDGSRITWVRVFSWSKESMFNIALRDAVTDIGTMDGARIVDAIARAIDASWVRRPMAEFEYLASEIQPPTWVLVVALVLGGGIAAFMSMKFHELDLDGELWSMIRRMRG